MYQVKVMNRQDGSLIMESDVFDTLAQADEMLARVGSGDGYYSLVFKISALANA
jgi:hypothetical protein